MRNLASLILVGAAMAVTQPASAKDSPKKSKDPNEVVCEKQTMVGSRLATRKVCATRAEWAERRRLDKEAIDQGQRSACMVTTTGSKGHASC